MQFFPERCCNSFPGPAEALARIGWRLIVSGQYLARIDVAAGRVRLMEPTAFDVSGGADPSSWRWALDFAGPSEVTTVRGIRDEALARIPWAVSPASPWSGTGPLTSSTALALANVEKRLSEEASSVSALVLPVPPAGAEAEGQSTSPASKLAADIAGAKGRPTIVETTSTGFGEGRMAAPAGDYAQRRIGFTPPETIAPLRAAIEEAVYAACGIPPALGTSEVASGQGMREAWRRYVHGSVTPMLRRIETEMRAKLDAPDLQLSAEPLHGADHAGRARAVAQYVASGFSPPEALDLAGVLP